MSMDGQETRRVRVLLADDHAIVRAGIRALLEGLGWLQVVGEADNGLEAMRLVEQLRPDVTLMDISMPVLNGLEVLARITRQYPEARVVILSMHSSEEYVMRALRAGAMGYLPKDVGADELQAALQTVMRGEVHLGPAVATRVAGYVRRVGEAPLPGEPGSNPLDRLTPRQREVLQQVAEGYTTQQIAVRLGIDAKTVEAHRAQIMERIDIHDLAGLVRFAIRTGLVSPER